MVYDARKISKSKEREPFEFIGISGKTYKLKHWKSLPKNLILRDEGQDESTVFYDMIAFGMSEEEFDKFEFEEPDMTVDDLNGIIQAWADHCGVDLKKSRRRSRY